LLSSRSIDPTQIPLAKKKAAGADAEPPSIKDVARGERLRDVVSKKVAELQDWGDLKKLVEKMRGQIKARCDVIDKNNKFYWHGLMNPAESIDSPMSCSVGSKEEMQMALTQTFFAWVETPFATGTVKKLIAGQF
jgi:hypothetical protein